MRRLLTFTFTFLIVLVFIIFVFNQSRIIELSVSDDISGIVFTERCVRYDLNKPFKLNGMVLALFETDKYVYSLDDKWTYQSGTFKYTRSRDRKIKTDVYLTFDIDTEGNGLLLYVDVPVNFENIVNSLSSSIKILNENKPKYPSDEEIHDNILDSFQHFWNCLKVIIIEYPSHYFKYISYILEDFNILWSY